MPDPRLYDRGRAGLGQPKSDAKDPAPPVDAATPTSIQADMRTAIELIVHVLSGDWTHLYCHEGKATIARLRDKYCD